MTVKIDYYSDVLCIWAYAAQIRMDELKQVFGEQITIDYRFVPIFGAGKQHVEANWQGKGGLAGFNQHLQTVAENWQHITLATNLWTEVAPQSSHSAHLYLKAAQLLALEGAIDNSDAKAFGGRSLFEQLVWRFRDGFFAQGLDISSREVQNQLAEELGLPLDKVQTKLDSGEAMAALYLDDKTRVDYKVPGSPTLVLNEGRQLLYGNVGYRILEANVRELIHRTEAGEPSWC